MFQRALALQKETQRAMLEQGYARLPELAKVELWRARRALGEGRYQVARHSLEFTAPPGSLRALGSPDGPRAASAGTAVLGLESGRDLGPHRRRRHAGAALRHLLPFPVQPLQDAAARIGHLRLPMRGPALRAPLFPRRASLRRAAAPCRRVQGPLPGHRPGPLEPDRGRGRVRGHVPPGRRLPVEAHLASGAGHPQGRAHGSGDPAHPAAVGAEHGAPPRSGQGHPPLPPRLRARHGARPGGPDRRRRAQERRGHASTRRWRVPCSSRSRGT